MRSLLFVVSYFYYSTVLRLEMLRVYCPITEYILCRAFIMPPLFQRVRFDCLPKHTNVHPSLRTPPSRNPPLHYDRMERTTSPVAVEARDDGILKSEDGHL